MEPGQITAKVVKDTLRALRYRREEALESPLLTLSALALHLREADLIDTPDNRRFRLRGFLHAVIVQERAALRTGTGDVGALDEAPAEGGDVAQERWQLEADYRTGSRKLEAWAMLEQRYFPLDEEETGKEVAARLGITAKTITRRLATGHELLAEWLRENEASAVQALGRRPGAAAADRVAVVGEGEGGGEPDGVAESSSVRVTSSSPSPGVAAAVVKLLAAIRDDETVLELTAGEAKLVAEVEAADPRSHRLSRFATWVGPEYALDRSFVSLSLLIDQGGQAAERFMPQEKRYDDLGTLIAEVEDPALVVLGAPGSGKSTLLRRLEMDVSAAGLRGESEAIPFMVRLSGFGSPLVGSPADTPGAWLAEEWRMANPAMPAFQQMVRAGPMLLLLDGLNEMPHESARAYHEQVAQWKTWLQTAARRHSGLRVIFSCRSLDYSRTLSTPSLRVPQVQVEPMSDGQIERYLKRRVPAVAEAVWRELERRDGIDVVRTPFFLRLLADQVAATGEMRSGRVALMSQFVRLALRREVEKDTPLFRPSELLSEIDFLRLSDSRTRWEPAWELPEDGALIPSIVALADGMQRAQRAGEGSLVRVSYRDALGLLPQDLGRDVIRAGATLSVLEEVPGREVGFQHQLVQEYFAARRLAREPDPGLVARPWRAADMDPPLEEILDSLEPTEPLPVLEQTGWEETVLLAAAMADEPATLLQGLMASNLALAGRAASQSEMREHLPAEMLDDLRWALVRRSRDPRADLRDRIACGYGVGELGDPRFERHAGPDGTYLLPPWIEIPGGGYPIGEDEPIAWDNTGSGGITRAHVPRHRVEVGPFRIAKFPVTNAEWRCFMDAGGYEDERWWDTPNARLWRRGELANEGRKYYDRQWRARFLSDSSLFERLESEGAFPSDEVRERWRYWMTLDDRAFEVAIAEHSSAQRFVEPSFWSSERDNRPTQPVVGVSWFEARAYAVWLSAQCGLDIRLPTEVEWEAAAGGAEGRTFPWGEEDVGARANVVETGLRGASPVGVFVTGDTPDGVADMAGNVAEWTASLYGEMEREAEDEPAFHYPYVAADGREDASAGSEVRRVLRGGSWSNKRSTLRVVVRHDLFPDGRYRGRGLRLVTSCT